MTTPLSYGSFLLAGCLVLTAPTAQGATYFSGTGFIVSRGGQAITNAHVLEDCAQTLVRTTDGTFLPATIEARDTTLDLALLATPLRPERPARLRNAIAGVKEKEAVIVMGYPQEAAQHGRYEIAYSSVRALTGLTGEADWLQFEDSVRMGNSGGPLLDYAGNVVGVVTGKAKLVRSNLLAARDEIVGASDFAINISTLKKFLDAQRVRYESRDSLMKISASQVERTAQGYIVNVLCKQK